MTDHFLRNHKLNQAQDFDVHRPKRDAVEEIKGNEKNKIPSVSRQIRHWICSSGPASRSISPGSVIGDGGTRGDSSERSAIEASGIEWVWERIGEEFGGNVCGSAIGHRSKP